MNKYCVNGHLKTVESTTQKYSKEGWKDGRACKQCSNDRKQKVQALNAPKVRRQRKEWHLRSTYGLQSLTERDAVLAAQGDACKICGTVDCTWGKGFQKVWHIDHAHDGTKNFRGVLCGRCNMMLGHLEKVGIDNVLEYLKVK